MDQPSMDTPLVAITVEWWPYSPLRSGTYGEPAMSLTRLWHHVPRRDDHVTFEVSPTNESGEPEPIVSGIVRQVFWTNHGVTIHVWP